MFMLSGYIVLGLVVVFSIVLIYALMKSTKMQEEEEERLFHEFLSSKEQDFMEQEHEG